MTPDEWKIYREALFKFMTESETGLSRFRVGIEDDESVQLRGDGDEQNQYTKSQLTLMNTYSMHHMIL